MQNPHPPSKPKLPLQNCKTATFMGSEMTHQPATNQKIMPCRAWAGRDVTGWINAPRTSMFAIFILSCSPSICLFLFSLRTRLYPILSPMATDFLSILRNRMAGIYGRHIMRQLTNVCWRATESAESNALSLPWMRRPIVMLPMAAF